MLVLIDNIFLAWTSWKIIARRLSSFLSPTPLPLLFLRPFFGEVGMLRFNFPWLTCVHCAGLGGHTLVREGKKNLYIFGTFYLMTPVVRLFRC